jgi:hypothetical protein
MNRKPFSLEVILLSLLASLATGSKSLGSTLARHRTNYATTSLCDAPGSTAQTTSGIMFRVSILVRLDDVT